MRSKSKKLKALVRQNWRCCWCGEPLTLEACTHEHILPDVLGGTDAYENMAVAHKRCNQLRSSNIWQDPHPSFLFDFIRDRLHEIRLKNAWFDQLPKDTQVRWSGETQSLVTV